MCKKLIYLMCFVLVLGLAGLASAATVWNPAANGIVPPATGDWGEAANWTNGIPDNPDTNKAVFNVPDAAECIVSGAQTANQWVQGDGADGGVVRVISGGSLSQTQAKWSAIGYNAPAHMIVEAGGLVEFNQHMWIGLNDGSVGTLDINGGVVTVAQMLGLGWNGGTATGYVNVNDGGLLAMSNIHGDGASSIKGDSLLSINGTGAVTLPGDFVDVIDAYAAAGLIAGDGVLGAVQAVVADDVTTVTVAPVTIPVSNAGFEDPVLDEDDWTWIDVPGWTQVGGDGPGVWNVTSADFDPVIAPEGQNVLYTENAVGDGGGVAQVLTETFAANTDYTLTVEVGNSWAYYWSGYSVQLLAGGTVIAEDNNTLWTDYMLWATSTVEYTYDPGDSGLVGQPLEIRLLNLGIDMDAAAPSVVGVEFDNVTLSYVAGAEPGVTIPVDPNSDLAAANALANPGDTILFAEGTYAITSQIEIKDGVTYQGAGAELTIIDGNDATRAFVAWGERGATDGQVDANGVAIPNLTGPKDWVIDGMTIQNCVADANNRQDILSAARNLLDNYTGTPYTLATAGEQSGAIADNPEAFEALSGGADDDLTDVELQAYLDANPPGSAGHYVVNDDKKDDGGAVCILNGADGTIRNCAFSNNSAVDDGGAIMVDGQDLDVTIENCAFNLNTCGDQAGAVKLSGAASNSTVIGCSFTENSAPEDDAGAIQMDGAGSTGSVYTLMDCTFTGCSAFDDGGAIFANADNSTYVWTNCTFTGNYVTDSGADGGAVRYNPNRADITVSNCAFIGNGKDPDGTAVGDDGGAWKTDNDNCGPMTFMNCLFVDNASKDDRILEVKGGSAILNCTFIGNVAGDEALIAVRGQAWDSTGDGNDDVTTDDSIISNCLFINNTLLSNKQIIGDTRDDVFAPTVINCLFFGNLDQNSEPAENTDDNSVEVGTIDVSAVTDAAQIVVDPAGDYHLAAGSPAIDASDPAPATDADIEGTAAVGVRDVGAYESAN